MKACRALLAVAWVAAVLGSSAGTAEMADLQPQARRKSSEISEKFQRPESAMAQWADGLAARSRLNTNRSPSPKPMATPELGSACDNLGEALILGTGFVPVVAGDRFGRTHVVWDGSGATLWYAQIGADGKIILPGRMVYDQAGSGFPSIAVDATGDVHVVTTHKSTTFGGLVYFKIAGGERVLLNAFHLQPDSGWNEQDFWPAIAMDPLTDLPVIAAEVHTSHGEFFGFPFQISVPIYSTYISSIRLDGSGNPIRASRFDAYFLQRTASYQFNLVGHPSVAVDSSGQVHIAWIHRGSEWTGFGIGYARAGASDWVVISNTLNGAGLGGRPIMRAGVNGNVDVVWSTTDNSVVWQEIDHNGAILIDDTIVSQPGARARWPRVATGFGTRVCSWSDGREGANSQIFSRSLPGDVKECNVSNSPGSAFNGDVAIVSATSSVHVWQDNRSGTSHIYCRTVGKGVVKPAAQIALTSTGRPLLPGSKLDPGDVVVNLENLGRDLLKGVVDVRIYLSRIERYDQDTARLLGTISDVPINLAAGEGTSATLGVTIPNLGKGDQGIWYLIAMIDSKRMVAGETGWSSGAASAPIWIGSVLNVLTHGFGNHLPQVMPDFKDVWFTLQSRFPAMAASHPVRNGITTLVADWESSQGWIQAFGLFAVKVIASNIKHPLVIAAWKIAAPLFQPAIDARMSEAARHAEEAAATIENQLIAGHLLGRPELSQDQYQIIHLIGHSRGAAVSARVARRLSERGYRINQYTALDGYSTDWPYGSGFLGDLSIADEIMASRIDRRVNFRVQQGLAEVLIVDGVLDNLVKAIHVMSGNSPESFRGLSPEARQALEDAIPGLKAPARGDFESPFILGFGGLKESNHLNVVDLYAQSYMRDEGNRYIAKSYLGDVLHRTAADRRQLQAPGPGPQGTLEFAGVGEPDPLQSFSDGDFEKLGRLWSAVDDVPAPGLDDPFLATLFGLLRDREGLLRSAWRTTGTVGLQRNDTGTWIELIGTTNASCAQVLNLKGNAKFLSFDLHVASAEAGDTLTVHFGTILIAQIALEARSSSERISVPLLDAHGLAETRFRLTGVGRKPPVIHLDNLTIDYALPRFGSVSLSGDFGLKAVIDSSGGRLCALFGSDDLKVWRLIRSFGTPQGSAEIELEEAQEFSRTRARFYRIKVVE